MDFGANYLDLKLIEQGNECEISSEKVWKMGLIVTISFLLNFHYITRFKTRVAIVDMTNFIP